MKKFIQVSKQKILIWFAYRILLRRVPSNAELVSISNDITQEKYTLDDLVVHKILSGEFIDLLDPIKYHLEFIHNARIKLIKYLLPEGEVILDIGGANGSLIEYGYSHKFKRLIITDLPPQERIEELKANDLENKWAHNSKIEILYTAMMDLSMIPDGSIDFVWVGQVVEHVFPDELEKAFMEISRVLKPDGYFCLDTPNGIMARIHSPEKLLHPEHKKEYTPDEMRKMLGKHFRIIEEKGLLPMVHSYTTREFSYRELILNNCLSDNLEYSYIMYFKCSKK